MANIDHYLEDIEVASRGEEVRDSIIDAFEALNSEGPGTMAWNNITGTPDTLTGYGVSDVPASMVSGVLALNNIPPSALERVVPVADDTARFALTSSDVQNGDTVKVLSTLKLYLVVDDTSLSTEAGYEEYRAGTADSVDWSGVLNTPDTLAGYGIGNAYTKDEVDDITTSEEVESAEGNPITIETDAAQYAKKTHLTLEPVQDLHGYDHPWPVGGGKNLFEPVLTSNYSGGNITITVKKDSSGNIIGYDIPSATANSFVNVTICRFVCNTSGSYVLTGCVVGNVGESVRALLWDNTASTDVIAQINSESNTVILTAEHTYILNVLVQNGATIGATSLKPMLRLATETDATFTPYSNICPITGVDEVEVRATGKNLLDVSQSESGGIDASGAYVASGSLWRGTQYMAVKPSASYYFSSNKAELILRICWYDSSKQFISRDQADLYTAPATAKYAKFTIYASGGITKETVDNADLQFELGSTATDYEPYKGYTASLDLPEPVYSGTLDLETGELVADMRVVDLGTLTWSYNTGDRFAADNQLANAKIDTSYSIQRNAICSRYQWKAGDALYNESGTGFSYYVEGSINRLFIKDTAYSDVTAFKTAMSGAQLVYELATPKTYQLTPQQLALFKGTNNIFTNAKTVQVTYRNGELATTGNIVDAVEVAKQNAIGESASYTDARLATELAPILGDLATAETSPTSASHAVGEYLLYNNRLYKVLAAISAGQQLTIGTNIGQTNVAAELASQASAISALNNEKYDLLNGISLGNANDLDTIRTVGNYRIHNASSIPAHAPENSRGRLYVYDGMLSNDVGANAICQTYITYPISITYVRYYKASTTSWSSWDKQPTRAEVDALNSKWIAASYYYNATEITLSGFSITDYGKSFFLFNANQSSIALIKVEKLSPEASSVTKISGGINFTISVSSNSFTLSADAKLWGETIIMYKP